MSDLYENLTDVELAREVYLAIVKPDDAVSDQVLDLYRPAESMAAALWARLRGPYCKVEGCGKPHTEHFPWCDDHLDEGLAQR